MKIAVGLVFVILCALKFTLAFADHETGGARRFLFYFFAGAWMLIVANYGIRAFPPQSIEFEISFASIAAGTILLLPRLGSLVETKVKEVVANQKQNQ